MLKTNPNKSSPKDAAGPAPLSRVIADLRGRSEGPTVVFVGGLHGNEPAGVAALERVAATLNEIAPEKLNGRFVAVTGNIAALSRRVRYIQEDLNRIWDRDRINGIFSNGQLAEGSSVETREQAALIKVTREIFDQAPGQVFVFDLHTTSAFSRPFVNIADTLANRQFAMSFPVPIILGIEEQLDCTFLNYINTLGHIAVGFEAGQHDAEIAVDNHVAFVWLCLDRACVVDASAFKDYRICFSALKQAAGGIQGFFEVRDRYHVEDPARFRMMPGFESFKVIRRGQLLARDQKRDVRAPEDGRILMPLYQTLGSDGFFTVRSIRRFWLGFSTFLRQSRLERILHWLPGVQRHPQAEQTFFVDTRVARWFALELFHLLGFRKEGYEGNRLMVTRRKNVSV